MEDGVVFYTMVRDSMNVGCVMSSGLAWVGIS
jgi:hypothetical protein